MHDDLGLLRLFKPKDPSCREVYFNVNIETFQLPPQLWFSTGVSAAQGGTCPLLVLPSLTPGEVLSGAWGTGWMWSSLDVCFPFSRGSQIRAVCGPKPSISLPIFCPVLQMFIPGCKSDILCFHGQHWKVSFSYVKRLSCIVSIRLLYHICTRVLPSWWIISSCVL